MKKFTKEIAAVLAAVSTCAAAGAGSIPNPNNQIKAETEAVPQTTMVTTTTSVVGTSGPDDASCTTLQKVPAVAGDMAPQDGYITTSSVPTVPPTAGAPLAPDNFITTTTSSVPTVPPTAGVPLASDDFIETPAVTTTEYEIPPLLGGMMISDPLDEDGRELYMLKLHTYDIHFKYFLLEHEKQLVSEGFSPEEAEKKCHSVYDEFMNSGIISDSSLKSEYKDYLFRLLYQTAEEAVSVITGNPGRDFSLDYDYDNPEPDSITVKLRLSDGELKNAEIYPSVYVVMNSDEMRYYSGKLNDMKLVNALRSGQSSIPVCVCIKNSFGEMTDEKAMEYFKDMSGITAPVEMQKSDSYAYFYTDVSEQEIATLSYYQQVDWLRYSSSKPSDPIPTAIPGNATPGNVSSAVTGDINSDGVTDITDLSMLSLSLVGDMKLSESQNTAADVDHDGSATLSDLAKIRQFLSRVIQSL